MGCEFAENVTHPMAMNQSQMERARCSGYHDTSLSLLLWILGILTTASASGVWSMLLCRVPSSLCFFGMRPKEGWLGIQCSPTNIFLHLYGQHLLIAFGKGS